MLGLDPDLSIVIFKEERYQRERGTFSVRGYYTESNGCAWIYSELLSHRDVPVYYQEIAR